MKTKIAQTKKQIIEAAILDRPYRFYWKVDKRKTTAKKFLSLGFSTKELSDMRSKHIDRIKPFVSTETPFQKKVEFLNRVKKAQFNPEAYSSRFNCTGIDWAAYHRPSSNGKGWVLIAPDEPANNWYIEDQMLLKLLTRKFMDN